MSLRAFLCLALVASLAPSQANPPVPASPKEILRAARESLAPDRRVLVFDVEASMEDGVLVLAGKVHDALLKRRLLEFAAARWKGGIRDRLVALPDPSVGERTKAVVSVSVANLRTEPFHSAELGTQALLGMPLSILDRKGDWLYVQTPNRYLSWTQDRIVPMTDREFQRWAARPKAIVTASFAVVRSRPDGGDPVSDVVAGCVLALGGTDGESLRVDYPDGRTGYLARREASPMAAWLPSARPEPDLIEATARRFLGVPYLWGGTSPKAMDCSGFTSTVFWLNGAILPRDASQQVHCGEEVPLDRGFGELRKGDLLFFGTCGRDGKPERVRHVGISLGGARLIHESIDVHVNSLDPSDPDYSPSLRASLLHARRVIGTESDLPRLADLPSFR
ncbi:MAG: C40 family peptidase [Planctomycetota bacterium]